MALDEPRLGEKLQMARDARLRLAENSDEFADREFGLREKGEQAQARRFTGSFEPGEQAVEREGLRAQ